MLFCFHVAFHMFDFGIKSDWRTFIKNTIVIILTFSDVMKYVNPEMFDNLYKTKPW